MAKYIHLASVDPNLFHTTDDYEMYKVRVEHGTFQDLHRAVFEACPRGFVCREPLALYHQVLWSSGVRVVKSTGESERVRLERDELRHAIEEDEYDVLWGPGAPSTPLLSICVDVDRVTAETLNEPPSRVVMAV